jgi:predicted ribosomally synthesized peptide with nif11-like leader
MKKDFTRFRARMNEDAAVQARLRKREDPVEVARELGYEVSREDFESAVKDEGTELSEFELELVSGGVASTASWGKLQPTKPGQLPINPEINQTGL